MAWKIARLRANMSPDLASCFVRTHKQESAPLCVLDFIQNSGGFLAPGWAFFGAPHPLNFPVAWKFDAQHRSAKHTLRKNYVGSYGSYHIISGEAWFW